jgi:hypothetical protein
MSVFSRRVKTLLARIGISRASTRLQEKIQLDYLYLLDIAPLGINIFDASKSDAYLA